MREDLEKNREESLKEKLVAETFRKTLNNFWRKSQGKSLEDLGGIIESIPEFLDKFLKKFFFF